MNLSSDFTIETARCRLRRPTLEDIPHIFSASRFPGFNDGMLWDPPESEAEMVAPLERSLERWDSGEAFTFTIELKETGAFIGRISIRPEEPQDTWSIGYWTHPTLQGQGYMSEAMPAILEFGFTRLGAATIEASYALWNKASERVLHKAGMTFARYLPEGFIKRGQWMEENVVMMTRKDYDARQAYQAYREALPKKRMGAGCLFFDAEGRILLVKPAYKPGWEIPGGAVELNESPKACCRREVQEELGLDVAIGELLVVDYNHASAEKSESLMFIFNGGELTPEQIAAIHLVEQELTAMAFFPPDALPEEMTTTLRRRVSAAWRQAARAGGVYLEDQDPA